MATASVGQIQEFQSGSESWSVSVECINCPSLQTILRMLNGTCFSERHRSQALQTIAQPHCSNTTEE